MTPEQIEVEGMRLFAPQDYDPALDDAITRQTCGSVVHCDCPMPTYDKRPLLAQCAMLLDSLLGGPGAGSGIIDEIRRVRAELKRSGW